MLTRTPRALRGGRQLPLPSPPALPPAPPPQAPPHPAPHPPTPCARAAAGPRPDRLRAEIARQAMPTSAGRAGGAGESTTRSSLSPAAPPPPCCLPACLPACHPCCLHPCRAAPTRLRRRLARTHTRAHTKHSRTPRPAPPHAQCPRTTPPPGVSRLSPPATRTECCCWHRPLPGTGARASSCSAGEVEEWTGGWGEGGGRCWGGGACCCEGQGRALHSARHATHTPPPPPTHTHAHTALQGPHHPPGGHSHWRTRGCAGAEGGCVRAGYALARRCMRHQVSERRFASPP